MLTSPIVVVEGRVTEPVNVGPLIGAFVARLDVIVPEKFASLPSAVANSLRVFSAAGAAPSTNPICSSAYP